MVNDTVSVRFVEGVVVSNAMDKTVVVECNRRVKNPLGKYVTKTSKMHAHDEENACALGDIVQVVQTRPRSKTKTWNLYKIVKAKQAKG